MIDAKESQSFVEPPVSPQQVGREGMLHPLDHAGQVSIVSDPKVDSDNQGEEHP